nr:chorismate mutase [uncultured Desulfuromusa sp.]
MANQDLDQLRQQIDRIDNEILDLLNQRANIAIEVGKTKQGNEKIILCAESGKGHLRTIDREKSRPLS